MIRWKNVHPNFETGSPNLNPLSTLQRADILVSATWMILMSSSYLVVLISKYGI
jgi:hypothetical protein